jgi:hypothetical protein
LINTSMAEELQIEDTEIKVEKKGAWRSFKEWFAALFKDEYEVTVWFFAGAVFDEAGNRVPLSRSKKVFILKNITKKTQTHIVGTDVFGKPFEIKTVEPFDYFIRKVS